MPEFTDPLWCDRHTVFVTLDLTGHTDSQHALSLPPSNSVLPADAGGAGHNGAVVPQTERTPADHGFRLPAPDATHERVIIAWPTMRRIEFWRGHLGAARDTYALIARAIAEYEPVLVIADEGEGRAAQGWLGSGIEVLELPIDDSWIRDNGPFFVRNDAGERAAVQFRFNGWGQRLAPWDRDASVGERLAAHLGLPFFVAPMVLEGGAVAVDGAGTLVATESSILNENRNPGMTKRDAETILRDYLGVHTIVWLARGLHDDWGTDGHVDNVVAFTRPGHVLLQGTTDASDPDWHTAIENRRRLEEVGIEVTEIDVLPHVQCFDEMVEVPYLNFYVANGAVFVPLAGAAADTEIVSRIAAHFPGHRAVGVPGTVLAYGGGGVHCITLPVPS
ncbi:MAG: agmatine deiminase family protein [Acidimicrobiales bacterium]|nr:agmatine deiminase family protein [Acidimicrobiales bacterium]